MRSPADLLIDLKEAIAQTLSQSQQLNRDLILTYSWDYHHANPSFRITPQTLTQLLKLANPQSYKFYWQQPNLTIAAIRNVAQLEPNISTDRFTQAQAFCQKYLMSAIAKGETSVGIVPTFALGGFAFHDRYPESESPNESEWQGFPNARLFIPQWLLQQTPNLPPVVSLSHCISPQDRLCDLQEFLSDRLIKFFQLTCINNPPQDSLEHIPEAISPFAPTEVTGDRPWIQIVEQAVSLIKQGTLEKVVLARALDIHTQRQPVEILTSLQQNYPECMTFLVDFGSSSFVGSTPETLLQFSESIDPITKLKNLHIKSDALAGSTRRGLSIAEDQLLGDILISSIKDRYEHEIVIRSICDRLQELNAQIEPVSLPQLKRLSNIQHLHTEIKAILADYPWVKSFDILKKLHPTAAVGGEPQNVSVQLIQTSEACDRGWYAAPVGWVNSHGTGIFAVGIRSGYLKGNLARIYAGAGIVVNSDIASELGETAIKFAALLKALS